jgi:hypothetical protein
MQAMPCLISLKDVLGLHFGGGFAWGQVKNAPRRPSGWGGGLLDAVELARQRRSASALILTCVRLAVGHPRP